MKTAFSPVSLLKSPSNLPPQQLPHWIRLQFIFSPFLPFRWNMVK
nr:MAG TPA: hypothetical protein [Bacteriophage sp.]